MAFGLGFLGKIFGSEKAMGSMVDGVVNGLDKLVYTKEEREEDAREERKQARSMVVDWMAKTSGQNLSRRFLAFVITFTWLFMYLLSAGMQVVIVWIEDDIVYTRLLANAATVGDLADGMTGAMMLILGFYFAAPHIGNIVGPALERFGNKPK